MLDTIFILPSHRKRGHAKSLLLRLFRKQKHLALSSPVSTQMLVLCLRICASNPIWRENVWIIGDSAGEKQNMWWSAYKLTKERDLDLTMTLQIKGNNARVLK